MSSMAYCPLCESAALERVAVLDNGQRGAFVCGQCSLEFIQPFLRVGAASSSVTAPDYLASMRTQYDELRDRIQSHAALRLAFFTQALGEKPTRILEVGAGTGWMVKALGELGCDVTGVEVDPDLIEVAHTLGANVQRADICEVDTGCFAAFDVVCSSQTLEHILSPVVAIHKMSALLRPGGLICIDVPNGDSWGARLRRRSHSDQNWGVLHLPHHQIGYRPQTLHYLLQSQRFEHIQIVERPTDDPTFGQAILPRRLLSKAALQLSHVLGHGYLLVGTGRKPLESKRTS